MALYFDRAIALFGNAVESALADARNNKSEAMAKMQEAMVMHRYLDLNQFR